MEELRELEQLDTALMMGQDDSVQESIDWIKKGNMKIKNKENTYKV